jgi:uncharacterized membrane protein
MIAKTFKELTPYILCVLLALPLALILTFMLSPVWNWFEAVSGIESMGHSGPADWCYVATFIALVSVFVVCDRIRKRRV